MSNMRTWNELETELLSNPDVKAEFEELRPHFEVISQIIQARKEQGLTQEELSVKK